AAECGLIPDRLLRLGIDQLVRLRLREERHRDARTPDGAVHAFVEALRRSPIALVPEAANAQHYEVPAGFFVEVLGRHLKYSCGLWRGDVASLDASEAAMLELTCQRARLEDGQQVLELGCGWGSLTLWVAERYPNSRVLAVSNSASQRAFIEARARERHLSNVDVVTSDMNVFSTERRFDRVVSVEMFEHMRNYEALLGRIASWLAPGGSLFVHVFSHRHHAYPFEDQGPQDWMARTFFSGGLMPSDDLLLHFQSDLVLEERWRLDGTHYARTAEAWLTRLDARRDAITALFARHHPLAEAERWVHRWRLFFLGVSGMFGFDEGQQWGVTHFRFARR
ncbi:MAG: class I SAM-dependent methyltransferase, partial [Myxococcaceae bacterium]|nr:class I SAM-dependent methyltransferase [Myxococcaceae bacterium]